uniref:Reverse transcriptase domain-containing protein n=1 Tax=Sinocyclocheilus grahami TaxID=75366 RepID=A0A672L3C7_SINGR
TGIKPQVLTGSYISPSFYLGRGTRQGCPLSPLLFNLLEPLDRAIRQCPAIVPISCINTSHKISLYADDVLLYISNITDSVKECAKSEIQTLPTMIPVSDQFNYLGIRVFPSLSHISKWNYQSLLDKIKSDFMCWSPLCLALHGRIATVKMNIQVHLNKLECCGKVNLFHINPYAPHLERTDGPQPRAV